MKKYMSSKRTKYILFVFLSLVMLLPMIFSVFGYKNGRLGGFYDKEEKPKLSISAFSSVEYQKELEKYLRQNIAFSDFFIRFSNELRYKLLNSANQNNVIIGKENYIYTDSYVYSYLGIDYQGKEKINSAVAKLAQVRDSLKIKGIDIVFLIAPGKGTFYPEYFPYRYSRLKPKTTNYETYSQAFNKYGINYLDFNSWICSLKGKTKYRLFSNTSVHWGQYACYLAVDSITKYLDSKYNIDLPKIKIKSIKESTTMYDSDDDIEKTVNRLTNIPDFPMPRLDFEFDTVDKDKLRVLSMGDSYFFGLDNLGLMNNIFYDSEFWYYFREVRSLKVKDLYVYELQDLKKEIEKNKLILIVFTEGNLHTTPKIFCDELYYLYCMKPNYKKELEWQTEKYKILINKSKKWKEDIRVKASQRGVSIDKAIEDDANYMAREFLKNKFKK